MCLFSCYLVKISLVTCVILLLHNGALSKNVIHHHRCSIEGKIQIREELECRPRRQVVPIPKTKYHDVFVPSAVAVDRCSGGCSNMISCSPKAVHTVCVLVDNKISSAYEFREVEEHLECSCCDITEDMCNENQEFISDECLCACRDEEEEVRCKEKNWNWDPSNCYCMCPTLPCLSTEEWSEEKCSCEEKKKHGNYFG